MDGCVSCTRIDTSVIRQLEWGSKCERIAPDPYGESYLVIRITSDLRPLKPIWGPLCEMQLMLNQINLLVLQIHDGRMAAKYTLNL